LRLLSCWYERFYGTLDEYHIIRYEDIVSSGGRALSAITPAARTLDEPLASWNLDALTTARRCVSSINCYWTGRVLTGASTPARA
jgi:hypothetical protein